MRRHPAYAKKRVDQPAPQIETAAQAEEALSLDEAREKLAAAKRADEDRRRKAGEEHARSKADLEAAARTVDAAKLRAKEAANREKAKRLPALIASQQQAEQERIAKVVAEREAVRKAYAERIAGWCRIILQRQGSLNSTFGQNQERWEACARYATYEATPKHWPVALRLDLVKAAKIAVGLLDHCVTNTRAYSRALDLAKRCAQVGPPKTEFERQREMEMFVAVGEAGNGMNQFRDGVLNRPAMDWVADPHIKQQDWALTEAFAKIFEQGAAYSTSDTPTQDGHAAIDQGRQEHRAYVKDEVRQKALQEKERPLVTKQKKADTGYDPTA